MKNLVSKTELLKALAVGESALWIPEGERQPSREMALFVTCAGRLGIQVAQECLTLSAPGVMGQAVVIVKRVA